jgi:hypothetical protein
MHKRTTCDGYYSIVSAFARYHQGLRLGYVDRSPTGYHGTNPLGFIIKELGLDYSRTQDVYDLNYTTDYSQVLLSLRHQHTSSCDAVYELGDRRGAPNPPWNLLSAMVFRVVDQHEADPHFNPPSDMVFSDATIK